MKFPLIQVDLMQHRFYFHCCKLFFKIALNKKKETFSKDDPGPVCPMTSNFPNKQKQRLNGLFCSAAALFMLPVLLVCACTSGPAPAPSADTKLARSYTRDQATLVQRINKTAITVAEQLELVLETSVPESVDVRFPSFSASLGDFTLIDMNTRPVRMTGAGKNVRVVHTAVYLIEPYLPGSYLIPPMKIDILDREKEGESVQIITDEIQVAVKSLLPQDEGSPAIKDIRGPLSLPGNTGLFLLTAMFLLLAILAATAFLYRKRKSGIKEPPGLRLRADELALHELERLLAEDLLKRGKAKLFHLRISDILRHYIENRFGLKAPERTTEEFLAELYAAEYQNNSIIGDHKALLADFLRHCDLVKFAKHEPSIAESEKTIAICREFIEETRKTGEKEKDKDKG